MRNLQEYILIKENEKSSVKTQLMFSFIGFGYMFQIKSVHHRTLTEDI